MRTPINNPAQLATHLHLVLEQLPEGIGEYPLLQQLRGDGCELLSDGPLSDSLTLFRHHFMLFHALYQLRDTLWQAQRAHLSISPLLIQLQPYAAADAALVADDPLRRYYLDLTNLHGTDAGEVERLIGSFWQRLRGGDEQQAALELFDLTSREAAEPGRVKQRFRQLVSQHHPDRGGETERLQAINHAREILARYYQ